MPEVVVTIGGREFEVACAEGEEHYLMTAAALLDAEASTLIEQVGRIPEARMLLMAGLMLADKHAALEERLRGLEARLAEAEAAAEAARAAPPPVPERVEIPVIPKEIAETMAELAARAEALADEVEVRARVGKDS